MSIYNTIFECEYLATNVSTVYNFQVDDIRQNGWVDCRMIRIIRTGPNGIISDEGYDAHVHDGTSHYMGSPYRGRYNTKTKSLRVYKGDGSVFFCDDFRSWSED